MATGSEMLELARPHIGEEYENVWGIMKIHRQITAVDENAIPGVRDHNPITGRHHT